MDLQPKRQPGRIDRKAALYAPQILRLRSAGFTYEAIREALADVGVALTESTLRREVRREVQRHVRRGEQLEPRPLPAQSQRSRWASVPTFPEDLTTDPGSPFESTYRPGAPARSKGHDIAEAFFDANPCNPLFRNKETP